MKYIKTYKKFLEGISTMTDLSSSGPTVYRQKPDKMPNLDILYNSIDDKFYTEDDYDNLYAEYLKIGGKPIFGFNLENLNNILIKLKNN